MRFSIARLLISITVIALFSATIKYHHESTKLHDIVEQNGELLSKVWQLKASGLQLEAASAEVAQKCQTTQLYGVPQYSWARFQG